MKKEIKIALVAIAAIVILFFGMNFLKGISLFSDDNVYYARFSDISGLAANNPIFANGYQVGLVKSVDYDYTGNGDIVVGFSVDDKMQLPVGTTAEIVSDFMGNVKMNLILSPENALGTVSSNDTLLSSETPMAVAGNHAMLTIGDTIQGQQAVGLMARAAALLPAVEQMLPKLDSILTSVNALMADPAIARSLHNVETVTAELKTSTRQLNTLMGNMNQKMPGLMTKADGVLDNAQQLTENLSAIDINATMKKVDQTLANVEAVTEKLNSPTGSAGMLLNDPSLYNRVNGTLNSAEQLLNDVREHPKRYINISIFGKKEK